MSNKETKLSKSSTKSRAVQDDEPLSAEEITFTRLVAKGYTLTKAYKQAFPAKKDLKIETIRKNASILVSKSNIALEVQSTKERTARLARLAEDRLEQILEEDQSDSKGSKVADVAMFLYDHANGKATQKVQHSGVFVHASYDLSGSGDEEPPKEVLDLLTDDNDNLTDKK